MTEIAIESADQQTPNAVEDQVDHPVDQVDQDEACKDEAESRNLVKNQRGATMLEWTLLLAAIALPSWFIIKMVLSALVGQYRMMTTLNGLPFP